MPITRFEEIEKPHLFAHRGGNQSGPHLENSKKAFISASKLGYRFLETDVILTRDKQVICYHGAQNWYTRRKSGLEIKRKMQKLTYGEIQKMKLLGNEPVPRLEDVLKALPESFFSIDTKTKEVVVPLVNLIKKLGAEERVVITSFNLLRTLKADLLLRGGTEKQASLCLNRTTTYLVRPLLGTFFSVLKSLGVGYLQVSYGGITRRVLEIAHSRGLYVYAWTVNGEQNIRKMLALDIDGIMSDDTELLMEITKS